VGVTGLINFCHGDFVMIGAFITYYLFTAGVNIYLCMLISFLSIGLLAYISFELFLGRILTTVTRNQILGTYGLGLLLQNAAMLIFSPVVRSMQATLLPSFKLGIIIIPGNYAFIALYGFALYAGLILLIYRTRFGLTMRLTSDNRELAMFTGVDTRRAYRSAFVVGGALAGAAGTLVAVLLYVYPSVGAEFTSKALAIVIMGGLGSIPGALLGAAVLAIVEGLVSAFVPNGASWGFGVSFVLLIVMLAVRPNGFFGKRGDRA
jgi:branched-chain amino acid transport system permease protein